MFISANTVHQIFELTQQEPIYEDVLRKYFPSTSLRDEFRNELWLNLFEHPEKTIYAWNQKYFLYHYLRIIKKQVISSDSPWQRTFIKNEELLMENLPENSEEQIYEFLVEEEELIEKEKKRNQLRKIDLINEALNHYYKHDPKFKTEGDAFKLHFFENLSIREISKRLRYTPTTVWENIQYATVLIKFYINKNQKI